MVIDFRVRPPTRTFPNLTIFRPELGGAAMVGPWAGPAPQSQVEKSMPLFLDELKEAGVVHAVVWGRAVSNAAESTPNDDVAAVVGEHPKLFSGLAGIKAPREGQIRSTMEELERALVKLKLRGITIEPGFSFSQTEGADDARLYPIYERCAELGAIVAYTISVRAGPSIRFSNPRAVDKVAGDFPDLKIVVGHAFWPWVNQSCGVAFRRDNVYLLPDFYGVRMPGHTGWVEAANSHLSDRIIFGSAYPVVDPRVLVKEYQKLGYKDGVLEKVLYKNAQALLGLDKTAA